MNCRCGNVEVSKLLLDTSAYSAFVAGNEDVLKEIRKADVLVLTPIVLGELRAGFAAGNRREVNEERLQSFLNSRRVQLIAVDEGTSMYFGEIYAYLRKKGKAIPSNDLWIAASAMQHGLIILTLDNHFSFVDQIIAKVLA